MQQLGWEPDESVPNRDKRVLPKGEVSRRRYFQRLIWGLRLATFELLFTAENQIYKSLKKQTSAFKMTSENGNAQRGHSSSFSIT